VFESRKIENGKIVRKIRRHANTLTTPEEWYILLSLKYGDRFISEFFSGQVLGRLKWILFDAGIYLLSDLKNLTDDDLCSLRGIGPNFIRAIRKVAPYNPELRF
jgi:hypothetical protein